MKKYFKMQNELRHSGGPILILILCVAFSGCDPNIHRPSDHPCNFPDFLSEKDLRSRRWYKIIDKSTSINLVDTTVGAVIHADSVILYDDKLNQQQSSYEYVIDNWVFTNLEPYKNVPFNDPQALLDLTEGTFYLKTAYNDWDTIHIIFNQCLIYDVKFNGQDTRKPKNDPNDGSSSFYFRK